MRLPHKNRVMSVAVVLALTGVLVALAVLQYRWSGQVSEAASDRMKANLQASMMHFREGLARELGGITLALQFDSRSTDPVAYARQIEQWKQTSAYPELVANVYVWRSAGARSQFLRLNPKTLKFERCDGPAGFDRLTQPLQEYASKVAESRKKTVRGETVLAQATSPRNGRQGRRQPEPQSPKGELATLGHNGRQPAGAVSNASDGEPAPTGNVLPAAGPEVAGDNTLSREGEARVPDPAWMRKRRSGWLTGQDGSSPFSGPSQHQAMVAAFNRMLNRQSMAMEAAAAPRKQASVISAASKASDNNLLHGDWRTEFGPQMVFELPSGRFTRGSGGFMTPQFGLTGPDANLIAGNAIRPAAVGLAIPQRRSSKTSAGALRDDKAKALLFHPHFAPWFIDERIPALLRPQLSEAEVRGGGGAAHGDWIIVELNKKVLQERIFPDLAERYFDGGRGSGYDIAVRADARNELIYSSGSEFGKQRNEAGDARLALLGGLGAGPGGPSGPARVSFAADRTSRDPRTELQKSGYRAAGSMLLPLQSGMPNGWELLARHRKGSLEAAVAGLRRRNLEISFGVLLVLGVTMAMVIVNTRRAQRLAMLQMDFVAGVSHELRTPLAVIRSAADNIADGIVSDKTKLARYGKLIRDHTRKLNSLVEQILSFAAAQKQNHHYNFVRVQPPEILESVLRDSAEMIRSAGFTLEKEIEPGLPAVVVDMSAVNHCLENLISNAVKYGGDARWIGIRLHATGKEVQISVQDKGIGMEASELRHIFDPFYRTPSVVAAQIHGTGLGLALARSMAEAIGGRLTVSSRLGKGSTFTLHLPYADQHTVSEETAAAVSAGSLQN